MSDHGSTETKILIGVVVGMVLLAVVVIGFTNAGIRATDADRQHRSVRSEACRSVEDETLRTLCLVQSR